MLQKKKMAKDFILCHLRSFRIYLSEQLLLEQFVPSEQSVAFELFLFVELFDCVPLLMLPVSLVQSVLWQLFVLLEPVLQFCES